MNQEQNNLNPNNFNIQSNTGISNNQQLNNQSFNQGMGFNQQPTPSFRQPIMQEPTPQHINNTFESGNANNQSFNGKTPKKMNLGLIIGIVTAVAVVGVGIAFGSKLLSNSGNNNNETNGSTNNNIEEETSTVKLPHEIFDVSKFDSTLFNGIIYDSKQTQYNVMDLLQAEDTTNETITIRGNYTAYYFTLDKNSENISWNYTGDYTDNKLIEFILKTLGNPSTIYESYSYFNDDKDKYTGMISLIYNYNDYIIDIMLNDYSQWKDYSYSLDLLGINIYTKDRFDEYWAPQLFKNFKSYGEKLF